MRAKDNPCPQVWLITWQTPDGEQHKTVRGTVASRNAKLASLIASGLSPELLGGQVPHWGPAPIPLALTRGRESSSAPRTVPDPAGLTRPSPQSPRPDCPAART